MTLTDEQKQKMERNRLAALRRKEELRRQRAQAAASQPPPSAQPNRDLNLNKQPSNNQSVGYESDTVSSFASPSANQPSQPSASDQSSNGQSNRNQHDQNNNPTNNQTNSCIAPAKRPNDDLLEADKRLKNDPKAEPPYKQTSKTPTIQTQFHSIPLKLDSEWYGDTGVNLVNFKGLDDLREEGPADVEQERWFPPTSKFEQQQTDETFFTVPNQVQYNVPKGFLKPNGPHVPRRAHPRDPNGEIPEAANGESYRIAALSRWRRIELNATMEEALANFDHNQRLYDDKAELLFNVMGWYQVVIDHEPGLFKPFTWKSLNCNQNPEGFWVTEANYQQQVLKETREKFKVLLAGNPIKYQGETARVRAEEKGLPYTPQIGFHCIYCLANRYKPGYAHQSLKHLLVNCPDKERIERRGKLRINFLPNSKVPERLQSVLAKAEKPNPAIGYVYWWFLNSDHGLGDRLRSELITRLREMQAGFNLIKQVYENKDYWMIAHLNRDQFIVLTGVLKDLLFENGRCWQLPECPVPTSDAIPLDNLNSPIILLLASDKSHPNGERLDTIKQSPEVDTSKKCDVCERPVGPTQNWTPCDVCREEINSWLNNAKDAEEFTFPIVYETVRAGCFVRESTIDLLAIRICSVPEAAHVRYIPGESLNAAYSLRGLPDLDHSYCRPKTHRTTAELLGTAIEPKTYATILCISGHFRLFTWTFHKNPQHIDLLIYDSILAYFEERDYKTLNEAAREFKERVFDQVPELKPLDMSVSALFFANQPENSNICGVVDLLALQHFVINKRLEEIHVLPNVRMLTVANILKHRFAFC